MGQLHVPPSSEDLKHGGRKEASSFMEPHFVECSATYFSVLWLQLYLALMLHTLITF